MFMSPVLRSLTHPPKVDAAQARTIIPITMGHYHEKADAEHV